MIQVLDFQRRRPRVQRPVHRLLWGLCALLLGLAFSLASQAQDTWYPYPHDGKAFDYTDDQLQSAWSQLHAGDLEPYPSADQLQQWLTKNAQIRQSIPGFKGDYAALSKQLLAAWRSYHKGDFRHAYEVGSKLGLAGAYVAERARAINNTYLVPKEQRAVVLAAEYNELSSKLDDRQLPYPNLYYNQAYVAGRYSQALSIPTALAKGMAGKVKRAAMQVLQMQPQHPEALTVLAAWNAEIVGQVGSVLGRMTYGASSEAARQKYQQAITLAPDFIPLRVEYAAGLLKLDRNANRNQALEQLHKAMALKPRDALSQLEQDRGRQLLDELNEHGG